MLKGVDISKYQGDVNFDLLRNAVNFVIIRSSYGNGYTDPKFTRNRDEARRTGMLCGFYHYAYPQYNTPEAEADWFLGVVGTPQNGEILALDFEENYGDPVGWSLRFLDRVSSRLNGYKPLIYINLALNNSYDFTSVVKANYGLWLARWDYNINGPIPNTDWNVVAMRQYSNNENIAGVAGGVDANVFYGERDTYLAYGYKAPSTDPQVPDEDQHIKVALALLKEFQANHSEEYGNIESAIRGLIGAYGDLINLKEDYRVYKENETERVQQIVNKERLEIEQGFETELTRLRNIATALQEEKLGEIPWRTLLTWAIKNLTKRG